jgi:hypothetical protein
MAGRCDGTQSRQEFLARRDAPHSRVGIERIDIELRQRIEAGGCAAAQTSSSRPIHTVARSNSTMFTA